MALVYQTSRSTLENLMPVCCRKSGNHIRHSHANRTIRDDSISDAHNETRKLWFWFFPSSNPLASDEITIWFNGGPGCSSLTGLIKENGPILWQAGTANFTKNSYTWVNLTNMVYVEQPIGVGFTQGTPNITNEVELGLQFVGFWKNFVSAFRLQGCKTYITGESYGGR
jgi:carboxypeptidase D